MPLIHATDTCRNSDRARTIYIYICEWAHMGPARALEEREGPARALEEREKFRKNAPLVFQHIFMTKTLSGSQETTFSCKKHLKNMLSFNV